LTSTTPERAAQQQIEILVVDDNPGDLRLAKEALHKSVLKINVNVAADGVEAMSFMRRSGMYSQAPRPSLVLLDLNMPKKDGRQLLAEMKVDPELASIPVIVFTSSASEEDILNSYSLHANAYITKPLALEQFTSVIRRIEEFWLSTAQLPPRGRRS
jgi:two-component system, chemotaxis family, response regulator Rcp1